MLQQQKHHKELFIVEGLSASSTVQQAMHKPTQSVLALQGKLVNAAKASPAKILANQQCKKLFQTLACGTKKNCNPDQLAFSRIVILSDPDIDGEHARALLLILFDNYLQALIHSGLVYIVVPPLYRVTKTQQSLVLYAWNKTELNTIIGEHKNQNDTAISQLKGIAQFSSTECSQLLLDPKTRNHRQISQASLMKSAKTN